MKWQSQSLICYELVFILHIGFPTYTEFNRTLQLNIEEDYIELCACNLDLCNSYISSSGVSTNFGDLERFANTLPAAHSSSTVPAKFNYIFELEPTVQCIDILLICKATIWYSDFDLVRNIYCYNLSQVYQMNHVVANGAVLLHEFNFNDPFGKWKLFCMLHHMYVQLLANA